MTTQADLLADIEAFLPERRITETTFGRLALNDWKFVERLRRSDNMTISTLDKARAFLVTEKARIASKAQAAA